jgi:imidazole glycerol-phosphate synthase subunit HisF
MSAKTRLIPCLLLKNGWLVRSEKFSLHQVIGDPTHEVSRYNTWGIDELIYLDITREEGYPIRRDVKRQVQPDPLAILEEVAKRCFMPLTFGGRIRTLQDIEARVSRGADKVVINTMALTAPDFITEASQKFGNQCIVVSIDAFKRADGVHEVYGNFGTRPTGWEIGHWAQEVEKRGAGEIFLNSIDRDGMASGYDKDLIQKVSRAVRIPVIACGGVGSYEHFSEGIEAGASAVSAANIFHFNELSNLLAKRVMQKRGVDVRVTTPARNPDALL